MIDLMDAYFHIAIHLVHSHMLFKGTAYEYLVLSFGLSLALQAFTKCLEAAVIPLRAQGIRILAYLHDLAIISHSRVQAQLNIAMVLSHM